MNDIPVELYYPKSLKFIDWENYLERRLSWNEVDIIECYRAEIHMNKHMVGLYKQCEQKKLFVPMLSELYGNCMFESLLYHNVSNSTRELRSVLSLVLYLYKDFKGFLPCVDDSFKEIFDRLNEIEYVELIDDHRNNDYHEKKYYKYTFNVMCQDITNKYSWSRLPTQLILLLVSFLYRLEIIIINNHSDYEHKINAFEALQNDEKPMLRTIYLGHINESHYVPLDVIKDDIDVMPLYYTESKANFKKWVNQMESIKINNYLKRCNEYQQINTNIDLNYLVEF